jgi:hypothetical protein
MKHSVTRHQQAWKQDLDDVREATSVLHATITGILVVQSQEYSSIQSHGIMGGGILSQPEDIITFCLMLNNQKLTLPEC